MNNARKAAIDAWKNRQTKESEQKAMAMATDRAKFQNTIENMLGDVSEIIETANYCIYKGIKIEADNLFGGKANPKNFCANSIHHQLGFVLNSKGDTVTSLGYMEGNVKNTNDFRVYPDRFHTIRAKSEACDLWNMKKFVVDFPDFQKRFYNYIDNIIKTI